MCNTKPTETVLEPDLAHLNLYSELDINCSLHTRTKCSSDVSYSERKIQAARPSESLLRLSCLPSSRDRRSTPNPLRITIHFSKYGSRSRSDSLFLHRHPTSWLLPPQQHWRARIWRTERRLESQPSRRSSPISPLFPQQVVHPHNGPYRRAVGRDAGHPRGG